jgi:hypothetical protein
LAANLGIGEANIVACELDGERSQAAVRRLPEAAIAEKTDFQAAVFQRGRASLLYLNTHGVRRASLFTLVVAPARPVDPIRIKANGTAQFPLRRLASPLHEESAVLHPMTALGKKFRVDRK